MNPSLLATVSAACLLVSAPVVSASPPRIYHNVNVVSASFDSVHVDGCRQTELYVAATAGRWQSRGGTNAQEGPASVFVRVIDLCSSDRSLGVAPAAAPPGGAVVLEVSAQAMIGLDTDQHLSTATVSGVMEGEDQDGTPVSVDVVATWTGVGQLVHDTGGVNSHFPEGNVSAVSNEWSRGAVGDAEVTVDGSTFTGHDDSSLIQRIKGRCIEVPKGSNPSPEDFFPCFGFAG